MDFILGKLWAWWWLKLEFWLWHVAWCTIDSSVSPALPHVGFVGGVGRSPPSPCMASWPFSHVSSATS